MAKNIEMNYLDSGGYEVLYPKNVSDISLASSELQTMLSLSEGDSIDDAFSSINDIIKAIQLGVAIVNLNVTLTDGTPVPFCEVTGITSRDGSSLVTNSEGKILSAQINEGDNLTISSACSDVSFSTSQTFIKGNVYNVSITNAQKSAVRSTVTSSKIVKVSGLTKSVDLCLVGAGGGSENVRDGEYSGGGGGGYVTNITDSKEGMKTYNIQIGSGVQEEDGGTTTVSGSISSSANGGKMGTLSSGGEGNGRGDDPTNDEGVYNTPGTVYIFNEQGLGLAGGGGGGACHGGYGPNPGALPNGGKGIDNKRGEDGKPFGGGGGGSDCKRNESNRGSSGGAGGVYLRYNF